MAHENTGPVAISDADADAAVAAAAPTTPTNENTEGLPSDNEGEVEGGEPTTTTENADPDRPAWLPEKFKTVEEMAAAYKELETKQGTKPADQQTNDGSKPPATPEGTAAADIVTKAGLEWGKLNEEWKAGGKLSDASYEAFKAQGVSKELVDSFINGQNAIAQASTNVARDAAYEAAGGETKLTAAMDWAKDNWDADSIGAFNRANASGDKASVKLAVQGLMAAHAKAGGTEPQNVQSGARGGQSVYQNVEQMIADMQDKRYDTDPAFRERVARKVERSNF